MKFSGQEKELIGRETKLTSEGSRLQAPAVQPARAAEEEDMEEDGEEELSDDPNVS